MRFARRVAAGLRSCWMTRHGAYPRGTYLIIFLAAWWWVCRSWWESGRINVMDLVWAVGSAVLMVLAFIEGFREGRPPGGAEPTRAS